MERWSGRVAVVTGASSGIGAAIAQELVKKGLKVVGLARRVERVEELSKSLGSAKGKLYAVKCDVTTEAEVKEAFKWVKSKLGGVDILVNNAAVANKSPLIDGDTEGLKQMLDLNVLGLSMCTKEAIQSMKERGVDDGHIVHINRVNKETMKPGACPVAEILCTLLKLVPAYLNYQSQGDLTSPEQLRDDDQYDFIIVGAGPAGCVLTNRLSEVEDWKVLLLEAGGEEPGLIQVPAFTPYTWGTRLNWNYTTQPDERVCGGTPCMWASGRGVGGGTLHNPMMYNRGNTHNFDEWESMGNVGWAYKGVLPYFKKFENNLDPSLMKDTKYHGVGGPQSVGSFPYKDKNVEAFFDVFKEMGYNEADVNGKTQTGFTMTQFFQQNGARLSASRAFLSAIRKERGNLKIITNVRVTKIIIDEEKENGNGVEYILENNRDVKGRIYAKKEVIISCGTISSAQLLMLSGIGPKDTLKSLGIPVIRDLKVGFNLQNHVYASGIDLLLNSKRSTIPPTNGDVLGDILKYAVGQRGPLSAEGIYGINAYTNSRFSNKDIDFPDIAVSLFPEVKFDNVTLADNFWIPFAYYNRVAVGVANTKPKSRGIVSINTTDPFSYPLIYPYYFYDDKDYEVLLDGYISMAKQFLTSKALKYLGISVDKTPLPKCRRFKFGSNKYWKCVVLKYRNFPHHYAGTCKMGPADDVTAVVDPQLRVHSVKNLRVIDASIMPVLVNANTNAAVLMIAEKGADMIKETWLNKTYNYQEK